MTDSDRQPGILWRPDVPFAPNRLPFFYGWVIVVGSTLGVLGSLPGQTVGVSVFTERLMADLGLTRNQVSSAYLVGTLISGLLLPAGGALFDKLGARRMIVLSAGGLALICAGFGLSPRILAGLNTLPLVNWMPPVTVALLLSTLGFFLIRFFGQGLLTMTARSMMGKWWHERRGLVVALSGTTVSGLFSFGPLTLEWLIQRFGWQGAYGVIGAALACLAVFGYLLFRDNPEECGLVMDGGWQPKQDRKPNSDLVIVRDFSRREALRTFPFWIYSLSLATTGLYATGYTFHILDIGESVELGKDILKIFVPSGIVSIISGAFLGWISDRIRLRWVLLASNLSLILAPTGLLLMPHPAGIGLVILGAGIGGGAFMTLSSTVWPRYFGRRQLGGITSVFMSLSVIFSALGPFLFALSRSLTGTYASVFVGTIIAALTLAALSLFAHNPQRKLAEAEGL
ncbi:MAG: MFS transporter [Opitutales bacterium]